jgi:hypothetical protein
MHASCCEGQGTRLFGSLPEYLYTLLGAPVSTALYVDLYADSAITFAVAGGAATLTQDTAWPYGSVVQLTLTLPVAQEFDLALRVPSWVAAASVGVVVDGTPWPARGAPGTYLHLSKAWPAGASLVTFALPMAWQAVRYEGASQLPPFQRWGYLFGPVLMAVEGGWNASLGAMVMPQPGGAPLDPAVPAAWLEPAGGANTLHFNVKGAPGWMAKPYCASASSPPRARARAQTSAMSKQPPSRSRPRARARAQTSAMSHPVHSFRAMLSPQLPFLATTHTHFCRRGAGRGRGLLRFPPLLGDNVTPTRDPER